MGTTTPAATEEPHVYTARGHMPVAALQYSTDWKVSDTFIQFTETYAYQGQVVKQSVHVFDRTGVTGAGAAATF